MGRAAFLDLQDADGRIQVMLRKNVAPEAYELLDDLDVGDWLGARGPLMRTRTGEATVEAHDCTLLSKSLRSLPEKWHGLADVETRYRQRYLDLISSDEARRIALIRSQDHQRPETPYGRTRLHRGRDPGAGPGGRRRHGDPVHDPLQVLWAAICTCA